MFFTHIFTHKTYAYHYEVKEDSDWMTKYFFSGGTMPSHTCSLLPEGSAAAVALAGERSAPRLTSEAWLQNMDANEAELLPILADIYGAGEGEVVRSLARVLSGVRRVLLLGRRQRVVRLSLLVHQKYSWFEFSHPDMQMLC